MNPFDQRWQRLAAMARQGAPEDITMPPGFATRIVARAGSGAPGTLLFERLALRAFFAATACCAAVVVFHFVERSPESLDEVGFDDPVSSVLDLAS